MTKTPKMVIRNACASIILMAKWSAVTELARQYARSGCGATANVVSAGICDYPPLVQALVDAGYDVNPDKFSLWVLELKLTSEASMYA